MSESVFKPGDWASDTRPLEARFTCAKCGSPAAAIRYLPPGQPMKLKPGPDTPPGVESFGIEIGRLELSGGPWAGVRSLGAAIAPAVLAAIEAGDAHRLEEIDWNLARFYCGRCDASYCIRCWQDVEPVYERGYGYDYTTAKCPKGHGGILDD